MIALRSVILLLIVFIFSTSASATLITIDFEEYEDMQNIHGLNLGGVTITNPNGIVEIFDFRFGLAANSGTNVIASFLNGPISSNPMIFTFDQAVDYVELFGGDGGGDSDSWTLVAYDAQVGGNLIAAVSSITTKGFPYLGLSIATTGIYRVEAIWDGPTDFGIGYDDLSFNIQSEIPLPPAMLVFLAGLTGIGAMKRMAKIKQA